MASEPKGLRHRVREAVEGPVGESNRLLNQLTDADAETRLSILVSGWGRGIAAALEELAIAVDELGRRRAEPAPEPAGSSPPTDAAPEPSATEEEEEEPSSDTGGAGDEELVDQAKRSREETAKLREEAQEARRELEH